MTTVKQNFVHTTIETHVNVYIIQYVTTTTQSDFWLGLVTLDALWHKLVTNEGRKFSKILEAIYLDCTLKNCAQLNLELV